MLLASITFANQPCITLEGWFTNSTVPDFIENYALGKSSNSVGTVMVTRNIIDTGGERIVFRVEDSTETLHYLRLRFRMPLSKITNINEMKAKAKTYFQNNEPHIYKAEISYHLCEAGNATFTGCKDEVYWSYERPAAPPAGESEKSKTVRSIVALLVAIGAIWAAIKGYGK